MLIQSLSFIIIELFLVQCVIFFLIYSLKPSHIGIAFRYLLLNIKYFAVKIIKFFILISGSCLFWGPKVMLLKVTSKNMLCSFRNSFNCIQKFCTCLHSQNKWFNVSISILQKSHKDELNNLHLFKNWFVGIILFKYLYWKSLILISFIVLCVVQYTFFQYNSLSKKHSFHFSVLTFSLQCRRCSAVYCKQVYLFVLLFEAGQKRLGPEKHLCFLASVELSSDLVLLWTRLIYFRKSVLGTLYKPVNSSKEYTNFDVNSLNRRY